MKKWINLFLGLAMVVLLASCNKDDPNAQFNKETKAIDAFLTEHTDPNRYLIYDSYGDRIVIKNMDDVASFGAPAHGDQFVHIRYTARQFPDTAQIIDSGIIKDTVKNLTVFGLKLGIVSLLKGSVASLFIPSTNAYGKQGGEIGSGTVLPNTSIVYDISIDTVIRKATERTQFKLDSATVRSYVDTIQNVIYHPSGFWYKMQVNGTGPYPKPYDQATFNYKISLLSNGSLIQQSSSPLTSSIFGLDLDALKVGILKMRAGGTATFYIPSTLGYGKYKVNTIPANANLIFTVQLNSF